MDKIAFDFMVKRENFSEGKMVDKTHSSIGFEKAGKVFMIFKGLPVGITGP